MEHDNEILAKVDEVMKRKKVSYEEARRALEATDFSTLDAVVYLESMKGEMYGELRGDKEKTVESIKKTTKETVEFSFKDKSFEAPLPAAVIGTLLLTRKPKLLITLAAGALAFGVDIKLKRGLKETNLTKPLREKIKVTADAFGLDKDKVSKTIDDLTDKIHF